jgi:hypothetical protein
VAAVCPPVIQTPPTRRLQERQATLPHDDVMVEARLDIADCLRLGGCHVARLIAGCERVESVQRVAA